MIVIVAAYLIGYLQLCHDTLTSTNVIPPDTGSVD